MASPAVPTADATLDIPALDVDGLEVVFPTRNGEIRAVAGVSYRIERATTLGVVGESGCGKSVTALAILGLVPRPGRITRGTVRVGDVTVTGLDEAGLTRIRGERVSMVFQEPMTALNPVLTIGEQIAEAWSLHRTGTAAMAREAALEMLERVRLPEPARRYRAYPHEMSGGMRQRAMIAMALACEPDVLIADEPTTALDVTIQAQVIELMADIQEKFGMAIQFISHNLGVISEIADRVAVMYAGRIVEEADTADLFHAPRHPYSLALIETVPRIGAGVDRLPAIKGTVPDPSALPRGCAFADRCPLADANCRAHEPPLETIAAGHKVACFKARD